MWFCFMIFFFLNIELYFVACTDLDNSVCDFYRMTLSLPQIKVFVIQLLQVTYPVSSFLEDLMLCPIPYSWIPIL